ncbi:hypothetical protein [Haloquadratum walsbyi]|uniref:hypothetical protein n=1 Tax=Haloquadratum walsbyi TaxID=293091 RepID=UPI00064E3E6C|nr:hypothetical protein [Haloquadratum walsbyi]
MVRPIHRVYPRDNNTTSVIEEDWDTLIILDACRADLFEKTINLDRFDRYERRVSAGSMTREWAQHNFAGRELGDTVYVSSNPYISTIAGDVFHELREVWRNKFDDEERTVLPDAVSEEARHAHLDNPNKRLVIHYMQPHYPFIDRPDLRFQSWHPDEIVDGDAGGERPHDPWQALAMGLVDRQTVWEAYADNLKRGVNEVFTFAATLNGKTIVTSDHGNMLGERAYPVPIRLYGHPEGIRHPALTEIPWAVINSGKRRDITAEEIKHTDAIDSRVVKSRLQDLGYV